MNEQELQQIRERVNTQQVLVFPMDVPSQTIGITQEVFQDRANLLAEVERLNTNTDMVWKRVPYQGGWLPITYRDELHWRDQRIADLESQLADMARSTIVSFALEGVGEQTIEKAKQILRDMGREDEIPD